ncbi:MAG: hypothetical protein DCC55_26575 [Chloroflexi bacterium]|nr:MAG: hypothetical protein DCC55_26575 [Chloroflexota bacterium]
MKIVVDTNILVNAFKRSNIKHLAVTMLLMSIPTAIICLDFEGIIDGEYRRNLSGLELYEKWVKEIRFDFCNGRLPNTHKVFLCSKQCHEPVDHTLIAVALNSHKVLFTEDSDMGKGAKGGVQPHTEVLHYLVHKLGIQVCDAGEAQALLLSLR